MKKLFVMLLILTLCFTVSGSLAELGTETESADTAADTAADTGAVAEVASLPIDFSAGYTPNEACFTEDGYKDASITV